MIGVVRACLRPIAFLLLPALFARASEWVRLTTPDFELFTDAGEQTGRDAIAHFEQVRSFFLQASPVRPREETRVRIVIFRNRDEFAPFAPNKQVIAYFTSDERRDYIVMADGSPESYPVAIHEYTHLMIRHSGLRVPVWLNEGWAEVYSSLRPVRDGVAVGDLLPGRVRVLGEGKWLTLASLGAVTTASPIYNEDDRAGIFYAESWALAHMLFLSPDYKEGFASLLANLHRGMPLPEALEAAYKRSPEQVFDDLLKYFNRKKLYGAVFKTTTDRSKAPIAVGQATPTEISLVHAELQTSLGHIPEAAAIAEKLRATQPALPEVAAASGYLEMRKGNAAGARAYFREAFDKGSTDARLCFVLAGLQQQIQEPPAAVIPLLERAVKLKPDYPDAQVQLGLLRLAVRDFPGALDVLSSIRNVKPELATTVFSGLSYSALQTGDVEEARKYLETARKWIRSPQEKQGIDQLSGFIAARAKSALAPHVGEVLKRVAGTVTNVQCATPASRLSLQTDGQTMELLLPEPAAVEFSHPGGGTLQLKCGPQKPFHVDIEYAVSPAALSIVRRIEF